MALFTTEIRTILKQYTDSHVISEQIEEGKKHIFDDSWQIIDDEYTGILQSKILRHYYMREIGFETEQLFCLKLNTELSEIAPKYNLLYKALDLFKENPISNINVTESMNETGTGNSTASGSNTSSNTSNTTDKATTTTTTSNTGTGNSDAWQTSNDTPQGGLEGIESNKYLSSAVHNKSTTDQTSNGSNSATSEGSQKNESTGKNESNSTAETNTTSEYVKKIIGKNSGSEYIESFQKLYTEMLNIDKMLIDELEPLFMGLWE